MNRLSDQVVREFNKGRETAFRKIYEQYVPKLRLV